MRTVKIERLDSMGLPVTETIEMLEENDFTAALDSLTIDFQWEFQKLVSRGLDVNRFIFVFRAEKNAAGQMLYDRFCLSHNHPAPPVTLEQIAGGPPRCADVGHCYNPDDVSPRECGRCHEIEEIKK